MAALRPRLAIIGGTGMNRWPGFEPLTTLNLETPFGPPSAALLIGHIGDQPATFLARHGDGHTTPPHRINSRANLWALREAGVQKVIALASVGGIASWMGPAAVAVPDDLIDYTWGREHSFMDGRIEALTSAHVDFSEPYSTGLRAALLAAAREAAIECHDGGVLAVTQGPRLETPAEIRRLRSDGCDMVGMTGMPEAALARELGLDYACLAVSVNWAAGLAEGGIHDSIQASVASGMAKVQALMPGALRRLHG